MTLRPSWARLPLDRLPLSPVAAARQWSSATMTRSRRNAMVALTALAERRREREDADAYLDAAVRRRADLPGPRRAPYAREVTHVTSR